MSDTFFLKGPTHIRALSPTPWAMIVSRQLDLSSMGAFMLMLRY